MTVSYATSALPSSLSALRQRLAPPPARNTVLPLGDERIDSVLPGGGLPLGRLHEMTSDGLAAETGIPGTVFIVSLLARLPPSSPVLWIAPCCDLYPPGLLEYGLDPGRLILARTDDDVGTQMAMETALREGGLAAVVGEMAALPRLPARRLHLACLARGVTGFVLRRRPFRQKRGQTPTREGTAATTRWRLSPAPSQPDLPPEPGPTRLHAELLYARGGRDGAWTLEVTDATHPVRVVAELSDLPAAPLRRAG
jgi:protein ImuA